MNLFSLKQINREDLKFEEREDGMYLWVKSGMASCHDLDNLQSILDQQGIMNYDWVRIKNIVTKANGKSEYAGEVFDVYENDKDMFINIQATSREALLSISKNVLDSEYEITVKDVAYKLKQQGIIFGIDWAMVSKFVNGKKFDNTVRIAESVPAVDGKPAVIRDIVKVEADTQPFIMANGKVDFRNIRSFPQVKQGDNLAEKVPPGKGVEGKDIFGKTIPARDGQDKNLPCGRNTFVSENGKFLVAEVDGVLYRYDNRLNIEEILIVPKNVDFSTGHIKYKGNVVVCGNVLTGFKIDTHGNIRIEGDVEGAEITSRKGNIEILGGVFGKNKARLFAAGFVDVRMLQDAEVRCRKEFRAEKYVFSCNVWAQSIILHRNCRIARNNFYAHDKIEINDIGENDEGNILTILDKVKEDTKDKLDKLNNLLEKTLVSLKPLENRIRAMAAMLKKIEETPSPKVREEIKMVQDQYRILLKKSEYIREQIAKTNSIRDINSRDGVIIIKGRLQTAIKLNMYDTILEINKPLEERSFIWTEDGIEQCSVQETGENE